MEHRSSTPRRESSAFVTGVGRCSGVDPGGSVGTKSRRLGARHAHRFAARFSRNRDPPTRRGGGPSAATRPDYNAGRLRRQVLLTDAEHGRALDLARADSARARWAQMSKLRSSEDLSPALALQVLLACGAPSGQVAGIRFLRRCLFGWQDMAPQGCFTVSQVKLLSHKRPCSSCCVQRPAQTSILCFAHLCVCMIRSLFERSALCRRR